MNSLRPENIQAIFESKPVETATWLVSFDALAAIARIAKEARLINHDEEIAARRLVSSIGNGDYRTTRNYFVSPEKYPPGMKQLAVKLGALSMRGRIDPPLMATITYRIDKRLRNHIPEDAEALRLYENAHSFPLYFEGAAEQKFAADSYSSLADLVMEIKSDTSYWIDKERANV